MKHLEVDASRELKVSISARRSYLSKRGRVGRPGDIDPTKGRFVRNICAIHLEDELHPLRRDIEATAEAHIDVVFSRVPQAQRRAAWSITDLCDRSRS